jgi:GLPGLI family protein
VFKLDIQIEGMNEEMLSMIPKSQSIQKELLFNKNESVFQNLKGEVVEDLDISSDDGSFQIKFMMDDDVEDILYKDQKSKSVVHQKGIMGKAFVVNEDLEKIKWKITNEKVMYLDYECQKAVLENENEFVVAWFTSQIPFQVGPSSYHGLPGAILMVSIDDGKVEFKANNVEFKDLGKDAIAKPSKGKKVSAEEYETIQKEKEEEIFKMHTRTESRSIGQ